MSSHSERNDRKRPSAQGRDFRSKPRKQNDFSRGQGDAKDWIWGTHAVEAALSNPRRPAPKRLLATPDRAKRLAPDLKTLPCLQVMEGQEIAKHLPQGAVHQGLALRIDEPEPMSIAEMGTPAEGLLVMLDQITDPQNIGAILRSAAAFGAVGLLMPERHSPEETGTLAKAASGALERLPIARTTNLARALGQLKDGGFWVAGLDGQAKQTLAEAGLSGKVALVLGAEGEGLRRLTRELCDYLVKIPQSGLVESLNVSNAAAVALYELVRR